MREAAELVAATGIVSCHRLREAFEVDEIVLTSVLSLERCGESDAVIVCSPEPSPIVFYIFGHMCLL